LTLGQFNRESKSCARKESKARNSCTASRRQAGVQPSPGKQGSITHKVTWEDEHHHFKCLPSSSSFPQLYVLSVISYGMQYPLGQMGSAVLAMSLSTSRAPPASSLVGWGEKQKRPWVSVSTAQQ